MDTAYGGKLNAHEKINLFGSLFKGRKDVIALRWERTNNTTTVRLKTMTLFVS